MSKKATLVDKREEACKVSGSLLRQRNLDPKTAHINSVNASLDEYVRVGNCNPVVYDYWVNTELSVKEEKAFLATWEKVLRQNER